MQVWQDIRGAQEWDWVQPLPPGQGGHPKYFIRDRQGRDFFLKLTRAGDYARQKELFGQLQTLSGRYSCVARPVDLGLCAAGRFCYRLQEWVYGQPLGQILKSYSPFEHYEAGVQLGLSLKKVHSLTLAQSRQCESLRRKFRQQAQQVIARGKAHQTQKKISENLLVLVQQGLPGLAEGPCSLLHGNPALRHALIAPLSGLILVDFDAYAYGHPLAELAKLLIDLRHCSDAFRTAILDVYFTNGLSGRNFRKLSSFVALELIRRLTEDSLSPAQRLVMDKILRDFDGFELTIPRWYRPLPFDEKIGESMRL